MSLSEEFEKTLFEKFKTGNKNIDNIFILNFIKILKNISGVKNYEEICNTLLKNLSIAKENDLIFDRLELKPIVYLSEIKDLKQQYIVVSNHPTGPLEGIFIQKIFKSIGLNGKIMGDDIMSGIEQLKDSYIGISIRVDGKSRIAQLRKIKKEISNGISLALFPAGSVSYFDLKEMKITDYEWEPGFIEMAKSNKLDILPVYIDANLSILHYVFKHIYPDLSSLRLFKEGINFMNKNKGKTIDLYIGNPISYSDVESTHEDAQKIKEICENLMFQSYKNIKI